MSKTKKVILGIFTILPAIFVLFYAVAFASFFFHTLIENAHHPDDFEQHFPSFIQSFFPWFIMVFVAGFTSFILMIYYIVHVARNVKFDTTQRLLWIFIILFTTTLGQIIYFIMEIWSTEPKEASSH